MGCSASNSNKVDIQRLLSGHRRKFKHHYILGRKVGYGAFAQVRLCCHRQTGDERVVKMITKPYSAEDFELEVLLLRSAGDGTCNNVVTFYDYFEDKRFYYSVMEYCRGGDLFAYVAACTKLTETKLADWMRQILQGVAHIHAQGIVHRDIKPQNLLFSDESHQTLKIVDFGLGFQMRKGELLDEPCGTPEFLSPEMVLGRYGRKVDVWAVGVLCYIFLFGCRPFASTTDPELFREIVETEPSYMPRAELPYEPSAVAINFCKTLLQKDSRRRPTAKEALKHPWLAGSIPPGSGDGTADREKDAVEIPTSIRKMARAETLAIDKKDYERGLLQRKTSHRDSFILEKEEQKFDGDSNISRPVPPVSVDVTPRKPQKRSTAAALPSLGLANSYARVSPCTDRKYTTRVNVSQYIGVLSDIDRLRVTEAFLPEPFSVVENTPESSAYLLDNLETPFPREAEAVRGALATTPCDNVSGLAPAKAFSIANGHRDTLEPSTLKGHSAAAAAASDNSHHAKSETTKQQPMPAVLERWRLKVLSKPSPLSQQQKQKAPLSVESALVKNKTGPPVEKLTRPLNPVTSSELMEENDFLPSPPVSPSAEALQEFPFGGVARFASKSLETNQSGLLTF